MSSAELPAIVLDTNALISAAILPRSTSAMALLQALRHFELVQSESTWQELVDVLARPKLNRYLDEEARHNFLQKIIKVTRFTTSKTVVADCADPKDNKFLALAADANARVLVSGAQHLRTMHPWRGVSICTPGEFLQQAAPLQGAAKTP